MCVGERCDLPGELAVLVTTPCFSFGKTLDTSGGAVRDGTCCGWAQCSTGEPISHEGSVSWTAVKPAQDSLRKMWFRWQWCFMEPKAMAMAVSEIGQPGTQADPPLTASVPLRVLWGVLKVCA